MWQNETSGAEKTLIHIDWNDSNWAYFLDGGAFNHEKEVLLNDGTKLQLEDITVVND